MRVTLREIPQTARGLGLGTPGDLEDFIEAAEPEQCQYFVERVPGQPGEVLTGAHRDRPLSVVGGSVESMCRLCSG